MKDTLWGEELAKSSMHSGPGEPLRELSQKEGSVSGSRGWGRASTVAWALVVPLEGLV